MAIALHWYTAEKTALCYSVQGQWTWYDVYMAVGRVQGILDRVSRRVDLLVDCTAADEPRMTTLRWSVARLASVAHPRLGIAVIAGETTLASVFMHTFRSADSRLADDFRLHQVAALDDACALLDARRDPSTFYIPRRPATSSG